MDLSLHLPSTPHCEGEAGPVAFVPAIGRQVVGTTTDSMDVVLCEYEDGRLTLLHASLDGREVPGSLLPLGRARIATHHLSPAVRRRLEVIGQADVAGADACNALLAFVSSSTGVEAGHAG